MKRFAIYCQGEDIVVVNFSLFAAREKMDELQVSQAARTILNNHNITSTEVLPFLDADDLQTLKQELSMGDFAKIKQFISKNKAVASNVFENPLQIDYVQLTHLSKLSGGQTWMCKYNTVKTAAVKYLYEVERDALISRIQTI